MTVYFGVLVGSLTQCLADSIGRAKVIKLAALLQSITGLLSALSTNYMTFLILRVLYGIGIGVVLPLSATIITELTPSYTRTVRYSESRSGWIYGNIITSIVCYFLIPGKQ